MLRTTCILIFTFAPFLSAAQLEPAASAPASAPADGIPPQRVAKLIADLSSTQWSTRQDATEELSDAGETAYAALKAEFQRTRSYEVKRRIRQIAEQIYFYRATTTRGGFLGIQHQGVGTSPMHPYIPDGEVWIQISGVVEGSAAQRAGLLRGDFVNELEGKRLRANDPMAFADWIGRQRPGTTVRLGVFRLVQRPSEPLRGEQMQVAAVLGRRKLENLNVLMQNPREQKMIDARNRFATWWRQEFDPRGEVDESIPVRNDPRWSLEPAAGSP